MNRHEVLCEHEVQSGGTMSCTTNFPSLKIVARNSNPGGSCYVDNASFEHNYAIEESNGGRSCAIKKL